MEKNIYLQKVVEKRGKGKRKPRKSREGKKGVWAGVDISSPRLPDSRVLGATIPGEKDKCAVHLMYDAARGGEQGRE